MHTQTGITSWIPGLTRGPYDLLIHIPCIIKLREELIAEVSLTIVTAHRRRNFASTRANFITITSIEHARWCHLRSRRLTWPKLRACDKIQFIHAWICVLVRLRACVLACVREHECVRTHVRSFVHAAGLVCLRRWETCRDVSLGQGIGEMKSKLVINLPS